MNKWLLRLGSSVLALTLITGCATDDNNDEDMEPIEEGPLNQEENNQDDNQDMLDDGNQDDQDMMDDNNQDDRNGQNEDDMNKDEKNNEDR